MDASMLDGFCRRAVEQGLGVYGVHVHSERLGQAERRFRCDDRTHLYSASKAFASMAVGIAQGEGRLKLEDSALGFFPQFRPMAACGSEKIAVRDLLQMRAGHGKSLFTSDERSHERAMDWAEAFFRQPMHRPAGAGFQYDNGCTYLLSRIVEEVSGQTLRDYLTRRLFEPLGIFNPQWHACPGGHTLGAIGLYLNTEELSRLGVLLLHGGDWKGRQLVPREYVRRAAEDAVDAEGFEDEENLRGYGYQLWRCTVPGAFRADGKYGQYCVVLPELEAVVTVTAHNERNANDILRAVWSEILPRLQ